MIRGRSAGSLVSAAVALGGHGERSGIGHDLTSLANASGRSKCSLLGGFCLLSFVLFILSGVLLRPYSAILVFLDLCVHRNVHLRRIKRRRPRAPGTPRPLPRPRESPGKVLPCAGLGKKEEDWRRGRLRVGVGGLRDPPGEGRLRGHGGGGEGAKGFRCLGRAGAAAF